MYLKEIELSGFKSFADRTRLDLQRGVTAVVGPNGCGKSNIVDALRWVLGEQSAKALRGGSMQDVIFEGTEKRRALPVCEVTLTFGDCEKDLGTAFNEVEISRKVTRDGGSNYYINGKTSRLKDIQRLFANTGVGRVSYSFMLQGQIDQILSTNPAERRIIFEEAAGVTLYKSQRKEALAKLVLVETNLNRVTDVIEEISRQIGSLKRQASKALRYKRIHHRLTHLDLASSAHRHGLLAQSIRVTANRAAEVRRDLEKLRERIGTAERVLVEHKANRQNAQNEVEEARQRLFSLRSEREKAENLIRLAAARTEDARKRAEQHQREIGEIESELEGLANKAKTESESKQMQIGVVDDSDRVFQKISGELVAAQENLSKLEAQAQERRKHVLEADNRITRARQRATTLEVELRTLEAKEGSLKASLGELSGEQPALEEAAALLVSKIGRVKTEQARLGEALEKERARSKDLHGRLKEAQREIQEADRALARKAAQLGVLESLQAKLEGFGEGAKAILGGKLGDTVQPESLAILSRTLKVEKRYTAALDTLLGSAADVLYVGHSEKALEIVAGLNERSLGRACLQVDLGERNAVFAAAAGNNADALKAAGVVPASEVVAAKHGALREPLRRLLDGCFFAESAESLFEFWRAHPEFAFVLVATAEGCLIDGRGLVYGGRASGRKPVSMLEREAEIETLKGEVAADKVSLSSLQSAASDIDSEREECDAGIETLRKEAGEVANELATLNAEERAERQKSEANQRQVDALQRQLDDSRNTRVEARAALEKAKQELIDAERSMTEEKTAGTQLDDTIVHAREERDRRREALAEVRLDLAEKKQRLETLDRALGEVRRASADLHQRRIRRQQERDHSLEEISRLEASRVEAESTVGGLAESIAASEFALKNSQGALAKLEESVEGDDRELGRIRGEERQLDQRLTQYEVKLAEERSQAGFIVESVQSEHQCAIDEIDWKNALWQAGLDFAKRVDLDAIDDPDQITDAPVDLRPDPSAEDLAELEKTDWEAVETEVRELKGRLASMGPVNLDAIAEYSDLRERYDFLKSQSDDLWNSKNTLVQAIDEINATSQSLFRDTFDQICRNFKYTYEKLSGGGFADLKLIDSEDPLESGIEIVARPPGTRVHSITLLSGGQRTMAAVALLFAIYLVKPSPFCVLDEIDAALDDANIGRFCETLKTFTERSQFLIITHNKRTISNADTIFGVTMPEKGVSNLLSMRFNRDTNAAEVAAPIPAS